MCSINWTKSRGHILFCKILSKRSPWALKDDEPWLFYCKDTPNSLGGMPLSLACKKSICSANICNEAALTKKNFIEASTRNIPSIIFFLKQVHYEYVCVIARKNAVHNTLWYFSQTKHAIYKQMPCILHGSEEKWCDYCLRFSTANVSRCFACYVV